MEPDPLPRDSGPDSPRAPFDVRRYRLHNSTAETALLYLLPGLHIEISASQVRENIREQIREQIHSAGGPSVSGSQLLSAPVLNYIRAHGLYR
jgi:nicotinic acid mononucleotide adenylyltransferase